jgi:hypothetical protein
MAMKHFTILYIMLLVFGNGKNIYAQDSTTTIMHWLREQNEAQVRPNLPTNGRQAMPIQSLPRPSYPELRPKHLLQPLNVSINMVKQGYISTEQRLQNYAKIGMGNYLAPYGELFLYTSRTTHSFTSLHLKHHSFLRGAVGGAASAYGFSKVEFSGQQQGKHFDALVQVGLDRRDIHFYGYEQPPARRQQSREHIHLLKARFVTTPRRSEHKRLSVGMDDEIRWLTQGNGLQELEVSGLVNGQYQYSRTHTVHATGQLSWASYRLAGVRNRALIQAKAYYAFRSKAFDFHLGGNFTVSSDSMATDQLYPLAEIESRLLNGKVVIQASAQGNTQKLMLRNLVLENNFLGRFQTPHHTLQDLEYAANIAFNINKLFRLKLGGSIGTYRNLYFFVNQPSRREEFGLVYEFEKAQVDQLFTEIFFKKEAWTLTAKAEHFAYNLPTVKTPWHRPEWVVTAQAAYSGLRYKAGLEYRQMRGIVAQATNGQAVALPTIHDLTIRGERIWRYKYTAFLEVRNLLGQSYQRYLYYPVWGLNFTAGVGLAF